MPLSCISCSVEPWRNVPCSTPVQPATTTLRAVSAANRPTGRQCPGRTVEVHHGPHPLRFGVAADCGDLFIGHGLIAPSRMLAVAKILITSPPSALVWRTISRSFAGAPDFSVIW